MNKIMKKKREKSKLEIILINHIKNNKKNYMITLLLFLIGMMMGILFINHVNDTQFAEISSYIKNLVNNLKAFENIDYGSLLRNSILSNFILVFIIWVASSTIIGIPIVYGVVIFRGFVLGYTINSIFASLGIGNGIVFALSNLLLHNIIFIPVILATAVSGMKLYKSIMKNREKENVKIEFFRHTIFCTLMLLLLVLSSLIEVYISTNLSKFLVKYIKI